MIDTTTIWNGAPLPEAAERLVLPDGSRLDDAVIFPRFCQDELGIDPGALWDELLEYPTWQDDVEIPFRACGEDPHWITGRHRALRYRGNELKRRKIWCQSGYAEGLRRYNYTGWQHRISFATHAVEHLPPVKAFAEKLNEGLTRSGHAAHNHWIVTAYDDQDFNIGYHSDKDRDFEPESFFVVLKLGATRDFGFKLPGAPQAFFVRPLEAGTAVFVRCKAPGAANGRVQHGVPPMTTPVGASGSIVSRCIRTLVPWATVRHEVERRSANP